MSILGNRVLRTEDPALLTVGGKYVDDIPLEGAVHVTYVRSTVASARINSIDTSDALAAPGVVAVFTAADMDLEPVASKPFNMEMKRPWLAIDTVRYVGDPVAIVVTEEHYQGEDAAEMVLVDYEPLDVVVDPEAAATDQILVHADAGTNTMFAMPARDPNPDLFADCEVVVDGKIINQRVAPCPLEPRAAAARWDDGKLTFWSSDQGAHDIKRSLVGTFGVEKDQVRVISPDVGGGFGAKAPLYPTEGLVAWVAQKTGRPARWVESRTESMLDLGHGRGQVQTARIGGDRDGKIKAYRLSIIQDGGAYPMVGALLPGMTRTMASGVYAIPVIEFDAVSVATNTCPTVPYRGAGRPEATAAIERMVDLFAAEIGMDPAEVRRRNFIPKDAFPYKTASRANYDSGDYEGALDRAIEAADYAGLRADQAARRERGDNKQLGIGFSVYVEITNPVAGGEFGSVELLAGGKAKVRTGTSPHGQGHYTAFKMIASDRLGIPMDDIEVTHGDTDDVKRGGGTGGSKSLQLGGTAITMASDSLIDMAREVAADLLEANVDDVVADTAAGRFHVQGTPAVAKTWADIADARASAEPLLAEADFQPEGSAFPFGAHIAVVEVDMETGEVRLINHIACDDAGTIINPLLCEGQVHGGIAQGAAQALFEEFVYDEAGNPQTANLADYAFPAASELPSYVRIPMETPTPINLLGAKGIGESATIGSTPAVQNAVIDALAHLGIRHLDMPLSAQRVWGAISGAQG